MSALSIRRGCILSLAIVASSFSTGSRAWAVCKNTVTCPASGILTAYQSLNNIAACKPDKTCADPRASCKNNKCSISLVGYLYLPSLTAPHGGFPVIIFNHGSNNDDPKHTAGRACAIVSYFLGKGYAVYAPVRRGYSPSTGTYFNELPSGLVALENEADDLEAAYKYVKGGAPLLNPAKVAVMGHSLGGIVTLFANQRDFGQRVVISIAGDSESWDNVPLRNAIFAAIDGAKHHTYFFEPANDVDTHPTVEFSRRAGLDGQQYQATIFPPVSYATSGEDAHVCFVSDSEQVKRWGKTTLDFLQRYGIQ